MNTTNELDLKNTIIETWNTSEDMLEVSLKSSGDFHKVIETLTRIGVESRRQKKLIQSCHILHKQGKYYLMHFKELFLLDGKNANFTLEDLYRRNTIAKLLQDWELLTIVEPKKIENKMISLKRIRILTFKEKQEYMLDSKYTIGKNSSASKRKPGQLSRQ